MAMGSIIWRCRKCGNKTRGKCVCHGAKYYISYRAHRKQKWEPVGKSKREAEGVLAEKMASLKNGTYREESKLSFKEYAQRWLKDYVSTRVKPRTMESYDQLLEKHLLPVFGEKKLSAINTADIQSFAAECLRGNKKLSPRTTNYLITVIKMIFRHACQRRVIRDNPSELISKVREERKEMDHLSSEHAKLLLEHSEEPYRTLFLTAVFTGMRRGEILALQWGDIDRRSNLIHVRRSLYWHHKKGDLVGQIKWAFTSPKTQGSTRAIVLSPKLKEALEIHQKHSPVSPHDLVFCTRKGTPLDPDNMVKKQFHPALTRAKLRRVRFHDLRHTYVALLIALGAHAKVIQSQLGHSSIQTTMDQYGHLLPQTHFGLGEKLDEQIWGDSSEKSASNVSSRRAA